MRPQEFREIRESLGLTQKELAEILGLSGYLTVTHYESGFRKPSVLIMGLMRIFRAWPEKKSLELRNELKAQTEKVRERSRKKKS